MTPLLIATQGGWPTLTDGRRNPGLSLTSYGRAVLAGERDYWTESGTERWLGGTRLGGDAPDWRWDSASGTVVRGPRR